LSHHWRTNCPQKVGDPDPTRLSSAEGIKRIKRSISYNGDSVGFEAIPLNAVAVRTLVSTTQHLGAYNDDGHPPAHAKRLAARDLFDGVTEC
jgi:hypothetical protein